jgi:anti-anti-sigma factor
VLSLNAEMDGSEDAVVMVFEGEYDLASKALLRKALSALAPIEEVVLDFSAVTYIDSTALCELLLFSRERLAGGRERATLVIRDANVHRLVDIASVAPMFEMAESIDEAVPHNGKRAVVRYASSYADPPAG